MSHDFWSMLLSPEPELEPSEANELLCSVFLISCNYNRLLVISQGACKHLTVFAVWDVYTKILYMCMNV